MIIRIILIAAVLLLALLALRSGSSSRGLAVRRLGLMAFTAGWIAAVLSPDSLTTLAHAVGVGRGTDLLLYVLVVAVALGSIGVYKRFMRLEDRIATLTRDLAIMTAQRADARQPSTQSPASTQPPIRIVPPPVDDERLTS